MIQTLPEITLMGIDNLHLGETLHCGQAFRWRETALGRHAGVVGHRAVTLWMAGDTLHITGDDNPAFWRHYFDLDTDYGAIKRDLAAHPALSEAVGYAPGIRVLRQDSWEALISFIISQNNHVGRIAGIIERLCALCGDPLGDGLFAFPRPEQIAAQTIDSLSPLQAGYRDKYLIDAAQKVMSGEVDLGRVAALPVDEARAELMRIKGVGQKVADCALLYGFHRVEVCPMDVWMKRAMARLFPGGWPDATAPVAGIAQQYIFHYARTCPGALNETAEEAPRHATTSS